MTTLSKMIVLLSVTAIVCISFSTSAYSWPLYSKPEFRGRVIDAETRQPIEGAVVVVAYGKWEVGGPGGGSTRTFDAKETLTDKNGEFFFPSYTTIIGPFSRTSSADFIIFKPGYRAISRSEGIEGIKVSDEKYFAIDKDMIGKEGEIKYIDDWETLRTYEGPLGIVELKRGEHDPLTPTDYRSEKLPLLFKALNEDRRSRGYKGELK
jgi:hypothetical protein